MIIQTTKQLRPRDEFDFYPTPPEVAAGALTTAAHYAPSVRTILDPGAGSGVWGTVARQRWPGALIAGVELRDVPRPKAYNFWYQGDFQLHTPHPCFDLVIGNPPYKFAESFVRLGLAMLDEGGVMVYLLRLAFLEGQARSRGLWRQHPPICVQVCGKRPSFVASGKTDATAYALFIWHRGYQGKTELAWTA